MCKLGLGTAEKVFSAGSSVSVCVLSHFSHSDSLQPHGLEPARLLCPWDFPGKNTGVDCHFLLQGTFLTLGSNLGLQHCRWILYHWATRERCCTKSSQVFGENRCWGRSLQGLPHSSTSCLLVRFLNAEDISGSTTRALRIEWGMEWKDLMQASFT